MLSAFAVFVNAQVIYHAHAAKEPGTMKYETFVEDDPDVYIFELRGNYLIKSDGEDDSSPTSYKYNSEVSKIMEAPSFLSKDKWGDYVLISIADNGDIIEIDDFDPDNPSESAYDKWCFVYRPTSSSSKITPPSVSYGGNSYSGNSYDGNSYGGRNSNSDGGLLESQYRQWENRARSNYNSLTNLGSQYRRNGKNVRGTTGQGMRPSNYTQMMRSLRDAQQEMRNIRQKATRQGINIPKSEYEDVVVNY